MSDQVETEEQAEETEAEEVQSVAPSEDKDSVQELSDLINAAQEAHSEDAEATQEAEGAEEKTEEGGKTEAETAETEDTESETDETEETETPEALEAPAHWTTEQRESFVSLAPEAQALLIERDKGFQSNYTKRVEELADSSRFADSVRQIVQPYEQQMALMGLDAPRAIGQLFALHRTYSENPVGYLQMVAKDVAQRTGVDLATLVTQGTEEVDPVVAPLMQRMDRMEQSFVQGQQATQQAQLSQQEAVVTAFAKEVDEGGNPKHPHFESVQHMIPGLIPIVTNENPGMASRDVLAQAYERAVWANPQLRTQLLEAEKNGAVAKKAQAEKKAESEAVAKAKKAKTAVKAGGGPSKQVVSGDLDTLISNAVNQHMG
ncbi:MAG: hypothetical protein ACR2PW_04485 [Gammaproteobacteria bacterium]